MLPHFEDTRRSQRIIMAVPDGSPQMAWFEMWVKHCRTLLFYASREKCTGKWMKCYDSPKCPKMREGYSNRTTTVQQSDDYDKFVMFIDCNVRSPSLSHHCPAIRFLLESQIPSPRVSSKCYHVTFSSVITFPHGDLRRIPGSFFGREILYSFVSDIANNKSTSLDFSVK